MEVISFSRAVTKTFIIIVITGAAPPVEHPSLP